MKKAFFDYIIEIMSSNDGIYFISAGLGYPRTDELLGKFPDRFIQCEASEQTALDIAVGLAYAGKIPFVYTITPFLYRGFETIRTYINHEELNVKLIGVGRNNDYSEHDGFSHDAMDDYIIFKTMKNIKCHWPNTIKGMQRYLDEAVENNMAYYINIER